MGRCRSSVSSKHQQQQRVFLRKFTPIPLSTPLLSNNHNHNHEKQENLTTLPEPTTKFLPHSHYQLQSNNTTTLGGGGGGGGVPLSITSTPTSPPCITVCYSAVSSPDVCLQLHSISGISVGIDAMENGTMGVGVGDGVCRDTMRILMVNEMRHRVKICKRRGSSSSSSSR